ncbi:MAG: trimeric autotransporter adhesin [Thermoanaerobaculia bacterium]|nr:trimeric autotransporter adhesin [Thermoanaerobaculia bacterium]
MIIRLDFRSFYGGHVSNRLWSCIFLAIPLSLSAQNYRVDTVAGLGTFGGDGGPATAALLFPGAVAVDANGIIYVSDSGNYRIRRIDNSGTITTLIGRGYGTFRGDYGPAALAGMSSAFSMALDRAGNLYFTDDANQRIREITTTGWVSTVAGNGNCGTTTAGVKATQAPLCDAESVAVDSQGRVFFASEAQVWMIAADGTLVLIAGTGGFDKTGDNGPATAAQIGYPGSLAVDATGNVFIADQFNFAIREVTTDKVIHTVATISTTSSTTVSLALDPSGNLFYVTGTKQVFKLVSGNPVTVATVTGVEDASYIAVDAAGAIYVSSVTNQRLLKIANANSASIAGAYPFGVDPLPDQATHVRLHLNPLLIGLAVDSAGNIYFPELDGNLFQRIDKVTPGGTMTALSAPAKLPTNGDFTVQAVAVGPNSVIYFSTFTQVYRLETNGTVTLIAGAPGFPTAVGDGGPATAAKISNPSSLAFDAIGNLYITEPFDSRVRKVTPGGTISTFAGNGHAGYSGDGGFASNALLSTPVDVKTDSNGNVFIADLTASVVRKVSSNGIITTVAGNGTQGFSGDGGSATQARLSGAAAIAVDPAGNLFIADRPSAASTISPATDNNRIRMVNTAGIISTIAGPQPGYNGEGISSTGAALGGPVALATDAQGNLYVNESSTQRIRKFTKVSGPIPPKRRAVL